MDAVLDRGRGGRCRRRRHGRRPRGARPAARRPGHASRRCDARSVTAPPPAASASSCTGGAAALGAAVAAVAGAAASRRLRIAPVSSSSRPGRPSAPARQRVEDLLRLRGDLVDAHAGGVVDGVEDGARRAGDGGLPDAAGAVLAGALPDLEQHGLDGAACRASSASCSRPSRTISGRPVASSYTTSSYRVSPTDCTWAPICCASAPGGNITVPASWTTTRRSTSTLPVSASTATSTNEARYGAPVFSSGGIVGGRGAQRQHVRRAAARRATVVAGSARRPRGSSPSRMSTSPRRRLERCRPPCCAAAPRMSADGEAHHLGVQVRRQSCRSAPCP